MAGNKKQDYYKGLPDDRKVLWLESEVDRLKTEAKDNRSTSQRIYNSDLLTNNDIEIVSLSELVDKDFPPNRWIVEGLIPKGGLTAISAKPKVGKTLLTLDLAVCLTTPQKFLGEFDVDPQKGVLIITKEDPERLTKERISAFTSNKDLPIYFCNAPHLFLDSDKYLEKLINIIESNSIEVIIIDSFRRIFQGDENSSQIISQVQNRLKIIEQRTGVTTILTHHHGKEGFFKKDGGDKLRGSSDILAMIDSLLTLETKGQGQVKVTQVVLRQDIPIPPFLIEFPNFQEGNHGFKFVSYIEEEAEKSDQAKSDILNLLGSGEEHNQTELLKILRESGHNYGNTTVKNALKDLAEGRKVFVRSNGKEKIYSLTQIYQEGSLLEREGNSETFI